MSKRSIGLLLSLILVIALGTIIQDFQFDGYVSGEQAVAQAADRDLALISQSVSDLRATQAGYFTTTQVPASGVARSTDLFDRMSRAVDARRAAAPNADARARYDAIGKSLASLSGFDSRARTLMSQEERLQASDLIYIDSQAVLDTLAADLASARKLEEASSAERVRRLSTLRLAVTGLALGLISLIALYLGRALIAAGQTQPASMAQMLRDLPPPVKQQVPPPAVAHAVPAPAPKSPVSLTAAAELCGDLARVLDGRDVAALLEKTASLLDAKGLVLWAADTSGAMLRPSMSHGYPEKIVSRLRPLQVDGDNVTALAFRSLQPQSLPGSTSSEAAALAVPLVTGAGCVGVLAAEVRQSRPHPDLIQVARIVAAQFSTLVAPVDESLQKTAQA
jgi:hypothetical protein